MIFQARRKTGRMDLEATEMAMRSAMHRAGASALTELLRFPVPPPSQRTIPCPCGNQALYKELRPKPILTALGEVTVLRPYRTVMWVSSPPMSNSTSKTRHFLQACAGCKPPSAKRPPSTTGAGS